MSCDWDSYLCEVEGKPTSILLDLGLFRDAPMPDYFCMAYVTLHLLNSDEHGLSNWEESETLLALEDALVPALTSEPGCIYAGRCTSNGQRDFIFYRSFAAGWKEQVASAMHGFPGYAFESGIQPEPEWDTYLDFLYPDASSLNSILNQRIMRRLAEQGDDPGLPRMIEHWLHFANSEDRTAFMRETSREKFTPFTESAERTGGIFGLQLKRRDTPGNLDPVTLRLRELAGSFNGEYDGWHSPVIRPANPVKSGRKGAFF